MAPDEVDRARNGSEDGSTGPGVPSVGAARPGRPRRSRRAAVWVAVACVLALLVAGGAVALVTHHAPDPRSVVSVAPAADAGPVPQGWQTADLPLLENRLHGLGIQGDVTVQGDHLEMDLQGSVDEDLLRRVLASSTIELRPVLYLGGPGGGKATGARGGGKAAGARGGGKGKGLGGDGKTAGARGAPTDASSLSQITDDLMTAFDALDCTDPAGLGARSDSDPSTPLVTCGVDSAQDPVAGTAKYILGPVEIDGTAIDDARAQPMTHAPGGLEDEWVVDLTLSTSGAERLAAVTERLAGQKDEGSWDPSTDTEGPNMLAIVIDGVVVSAPGVVERVPDGEAEISGSFTETSATALAADLRSGPLPVPLTITRLRLPAD